MAVATADAVFRPTAATELEPALDAIALAIDRPTAAAVLVPVAEAVAGLIA